MSQVSDPSAAPHLCATSISQCAPVDNDPRLTSGKSSPFCIAARVEAPFAPSWESVRQQILSLARLQLLHDASCRLQVEKDFTSDELMLDSPDVISSMSVLNATNSNSAIVKKAHDLLTDVLEDFSALEGWRPEQIGNYLVGYLRGETSLETIERLVRRVLMGNHHELSALDRELDRVQDVMKARWISTQVSNRFEVDKLKQILLACENVDLVLDDLVRSQLSRTLSMPCSHAISVVAAMECGYRPTAEKYLLNIYCAIKPEIERGRLLMTPLIPSWLRNAIVPIFIRDKDTSLDGLLTGDRWLSRIGADCRSADVFPVYAPHFESCPPKRIIPLMRSEHKEFKSDSKLSKFLRALFSGRDGGACRTLYTHLTYSARTCCVPQGRVVATIWARACSSWAIRYGCILVASIEKVVSVRALAAIYAGGGGFVGFRHGFCECIISGIFTRKFELDTAEGLLSGHPIIGGSYRIKVDGNPDRRDLEVLSTVINAVESKGIEVDLRGVKHVPFLYSSVNFILDGKRTGVYEKWCKQRIKLSFAE